MILEEDMAFFPLAEAGPDLVLAFLNEFAELGRFAFVLKDLAAVEPMLDMVAF